MDNRPVGIFDSGLGGLNSLKALRALMPNENIIYFGDTGRNPYGVRPAEELRIMARQDMELMAKLGAKAVIAACGTVSSTAGDILAGFRLPVINVIDASVQRLAQTASDAPLGIIATSASIKNGAFKRRLAALCPGREIIDIACQDFVQLIESGHTDKDDEMLAEAVARYLAPMREAHVGALLLGCTHFDFAADAIRAYLGRDTALISAAGCAAENMRDYLTAHALTGESAEAATEYYTSGSTSEFAAHAARFLGGDKEPTVHAASAEETEGLR